MKKNVWKTAVLFLLSMILLNGMHRMTGAQAEEKASFTGHPEAIEEACSSLVMLDVYDRHDSRITRGSGFIAFDDHTLVTSCHVIVNMEYMIVTCENGDSFRVDHIVELDENADVALCLLPDDFSLTPLPVREDLPLRGEKAAAIGSAKGLLNLVTLGNVCGIWENSGISWILFTAPVSAGSSGGALLDDDGNVIGVVMGSYNDTQNLNFAVPIQEAARLYRGLKGESITHD